MRLDVNIYMSRENVRRGGPHLWTDAQPPRYQAHSNSESHYTTDKSDKHNQYRVVLPTLDETVIIETSVPADWEAGKLALILFGLSCCIQVIILLVF